MCEEEGVQGTVVDLGPMAEANRSTAVYGKHNLRMNNRVGQREGLRWDTQVIGTTIQEEENAVLDIHHTKICQHFPDVDSLRAFYLSV